MYVNPKSRYLFSPKRSVINFWLGPKYTSEHIKLFHNGDPFHRETSPLICRASQWTGFYMMIGTSTMKELNKKL